MLTSEEVSSLLLHRSDELYKGYTVWLFISDDTMNKS